MTANTGSYHIPVMAAQCMEGLALKPNGTYLDCTLGGAGHFRLIIEALDQRGSAVGVDRDPEALSWARSNLPTPRCRMILEQARFSQFDGVLKNHSIDAVDGVLLDLGLSSHQIDAPERGFAYMTDSPLDMRMDPSLTTTAAQLLNDADEPTLTRIFDQYGEVRNPARMARTIIHCRQKRAFATSDQLKECLHREYGPNLKIRLLAKVFQALRIAVNGELDELQVFLEKLPDHLHLGGRMVVLSYHSLEDRMVKEFIRRNEQPCTCLKSAPLCVCGKPVRLKRVNKKAVKAGDAEISANSRARSARLRIAEKV